MEGEPMSGNLFGDFAAELAGEPAPPVPDPVPVQDPEPKPVEADPAPISADFASTIQPGKRDPSRLVASFSCIACSAIDEVLEPAPDWVECWSKGCSTRMHRFVPPKAPPHFNARMLTSEETARLATSRWSE
jgi:hypothetical protein